MVAEYVCSMTSQNNVLLRQPNEKRWTLTTANCQEDIQFGYDMRGKSYDKYDPCYAVPRR